MANAPDVRIQTVLYQSGVPACSRFVTAACAAATMALRGGSIGRAVLAIGDSSPVPVLGEKQLEEIGAQAAAAGIDEFVYDHFQANLGSAGGHNRLFRQGDEDFALVLNPDAYASPHLISELLLPHGDRLVGMTEARQLPLEHPKDYDHATGETSWATGACMLVRRDVITKTDGFDPVNFFLYCDDVDFSWRARLAGFRVIHQPAARVYHDKRLTTAGQVVVTAAENYYAAEGSLMLAWKYSRPDLADQWLTDLGASPNPDHRRAAEAFARRRDAGELPEQIDPDHRVAQFIDGDFAPHRFSYRD